jgi:hypothetical protein
MIRTLVTVAVATHATSALAGGHCHEVSPIVGYQHCGSFGSRWAHGVRTAWGMQIGPVVERIGLHVVSDSGTSYSPTATTIYHAAVPPGSDLHPLGYGGRIQWGYHDQLLSAGISSTVVFFGHPSVVTTQDDGQPPVTSHGGDALDLAAFVGVHDRIGALGYGAELAVGARFVFLYAALPDGYTTCAGGASGKGCYAALGDTRALVEPRVFVEYWLQRQVSMRLTAGYAALGDGQTVALAVAFHLSPYDGN